MPKTAGVNAQFEDGAGRSVAFRAGALDMFVIKGPLCIQLFTLLLLLPTPGTRCEQSFNFGSESRSQSLPGGSTLYSSSFSSNNASFALKINNSNSNSNSTSTSPSPVLEEDFPFENNTYSNTTVPLGDTAYLKCTVRNLGERSVIWLRRRDMHIISVGKNVYSNDGRFHILNIEGSDDWVLQIKYIQKRDNGTYECSVSTAKGIASYAVHVFVAVPEAFILGNGEYHIQEGSTINLVCIVEKSPRVPDFIFWFHNSRMINYDKGRNLRIQTDTGTKTHSRLIIDNAQVADSGNYTCHISNADPASTLVYISQDYSYTGDKMAAIQRRKSAASLTPIHYLFHQIFPILLSLIYFKIFQ